MAFGGDLRMDGAVLAARRAGWETQHIRSEEDKLEWESADAVLLPWPHSFREGMLVGTAMRKEETLARLPLCSVASYGAGVRADELPRAQQKYNPERDEAFLMLNAQLTAEGAIARAMARPNRALLGSTCLVTGFGRIGQALAQRLAALGAFVIVCARSETQMQRAHGMGAHPTPLSGIAQAAAQADVIFNTVPARIMGRRALMAMEKETLIIELASAPYGVDMELAAELGISAALESGVPGRYAPLDAGAAIFESLQRALLQTGTGEGGKRDG